MAKKIESPFDDEQPRPCLTEEEARQVAEFEAERGVRKPKKPQDLPEMTRRVAEIEDELARRGADPLIEEMAELKKDIKTRMLAENRECVFDEVSEYESVLVDRARDVWDAGAFEVMLKSTQKKRYITKSVDTDAVKTGVKSGDLSRAKMEKNGAVRKEPMGPALYVRKRKSEEEDEDE